MSSVQPAWSAGYSVCVPAAWGSSEPSAWMRRKSRARVWLAILARAMFPMLVPAVAVRVMTTRIPAPSSKARRRRATARLRSASGMPVTTPLVPPPSRILCVDEPGPIGSVFRLTRRSWPGSSTTVGLVPAVAGVVASAAATRRSAMRIGGLRDDAIDLEDLGVVAVHVRPVDARDVPDVVGVRVAAVLLRRVALHSRDLVLDVALLQRN